MRTLHIVSHTHWDREWYLTFQEFRFRLVHLLDDLLDLLERDPEYRSFLLDGQTIVLDDYLQIRPEQEARIRRLVQDGRLLIGPWYVLPDEFLEGPEALIRNALFGRRGCRRFAPDPMPMERIAYLPDPFGHISQLPQIANQLDMEALCFWRGVGQAPTEFQWVAPDGNECLVLHLRTSYGNAARLAADEDGFIRDLAAARDALAPHAVTSHLLLMHGTDHMQPRPDLHSRLQAAGRLLDERVVHSTLPAYLAAVRSELGADGQSALSRVRGELRSPETAHLLPAVLSTRMWIKQSNHRCETLLVRWAEPFSALARHVAGDMRMTGFLRQAWTWLLRNHPHDSICGCSVDQVHREMRSRFAWTEQIATQVTQTSLEALASRAGNANSGSPGIVDPEAPKASPAERRAATIVVFNPLSSRASGRVQVQIPALPGEAWAIVDDLGRPVPARRLASLTREHFNELMDREKLLGLLTQIAAGGGPSLGDLSFQRLDTHVASSIAHLDLLVTSRPDSPDLGTAIQDSLERVQALLADEQIRGFRVRVVEDAGAQVEFVAHDVPPVGYAPFAVRVLADAAPAPRQAPHGSCEGLTIENEFFTVEADPADGTVRITDRQTGMTMVGANRFVDGGDRGDEYTYTPPESDVLVDGPSRPPDILRDDDGIGQSLTVSPRYQVPKSLAPGDRSRRNDELVDLPITTRIVLTPGVRRVQFDTTIHNQAEDHRLRVHFPTPVATDRSWAEGQFDVVERSIALPTETQGWAEQPVGTHPQLAFTDVTDGQQGVMLANRGLPECEILPAVDSLPGVTLALTLLRSVGWLSRGDLHNRTGHAGPAVPTPEAQCPGEHRFHYALIPHAGNYLTVQHEAHAFSVGLRAVCTEAATVPLPSRASFVQVSPAAALLSTIKLPEEGDGLILRLVNSAPTPVQARIKLWRTFQRAALVSLHEEGPGQPLAIDRDSVTLPLRAREIATLRFSGSKGPGPSNATWKGS